MHTGTNLHRSRLPTAWACASSATAYDSQVGGADQRGHIRTSPASKAKEGIGGNPLSGGPPYLLLPGCPPTYGPTRPVAGSDALGTRPPRANPSPFGRFFFSLADGLTVGP